MQLQPDDIVKKAREYIGTPFVHQGRSKDGLDCIGLVIKVLKDLELLDKNFDFTAYSRSPDPQIFMTTFLKYTYFVPLSTIDTADILIFNLPFSPCHVGIYDANNNTFIHAYLHRKIVREDRYNNYFKQLTYNAVRLPIFRRSI